MNADKLARLAAAVRTGGPGSVRRKKKAVHKNATADDKKLQSTLKRLGVNNIPGIEEVNLFKDDGSVIHFSNPKGKRAPRIHKHFTHFFFSTSIHSRKHLCHQRPCRDKEYVTPPTLITIAPQSQPFAYHAYALSELQELLPGIINQLGPDNLANLKKIAEHYSKKEDTGGDDEVPELVDNFEDASK